jgi:hypothetical protein
MPTVSPKRLELLIATARSNPEFARRLLNELPDDFRALVLTELARPKQVATTSLTGPGLEKCQPRALPNNGLSAQLNLFAKAASRVS